MPVSVRPQRRQSQLFTDDLSTPVYGNDDASSALAQATSAQAEGDQGAAASYFSQATAAIGDGWTRANSAWSSYTSACERAP